MPYLTIISKNQEFFCQYDEQDQELIDRYKWHMNGRYVFTKIKGRSIGLHRIIMNIKDPSLDIDHKDGDPLNNTRANLRVCTRSENARNSRKFKGTSKYKGVYRDLNTYHAQIGQGGTVKNLGRYRSERTAAKQYDKEARHLYGAFANPNFREPGIEPTQLTIF